MYKFGGGGLFEYAVRHAQEVLPLPSGCLSENISEGIVVAYLAVLRFSQISLKDYTYNSLDISAAQKEKKGEAQVSHIYFML